MKFSELKKLEIGTFIKITGNLRSTERACGLHPKMNSMKGKVYPFRGLVNFRKSAKINGFEWHPSDLSIAPKPEPIIFDAKNLDT